MQCTQLRHTHTHTGSGESTAKPTAAATAKQRALLKQIHGPASSNATPLVPNAAPSLPEQESIWPGQPAPVKAYEERKVAVQAAPPLRFDEMFKGEGVYEPLVQKHSVREPSTEIMNRDMLRGEPAAKDVMMAAKEPLKDATRDSAASVAALLEQLSQAEKAQQSLQKQLDQELAHREQMEKDMIYTKAKMETLYQASEKAQAESEQAKATLQKAKADADVFKKQVDVLQAELDAMRSKEHNLKLQGAQGNNMDDDASKAATATLTTTLQNALFDTTASFEGQENLVLEAKALAPAGFLGQCASIISVALLFNKLSADDGFDAFDQDHDGEISRDDMSKSIEALHLVDFKKHITEFHRLADTRNTGKLSRGDWAKAIATADVQSLLLSNRGSSPDGSFKLEESLGLVAASLYLNHATLQEGFEAFDLDKDSKLSVEDLIHSIHKLQLGLEDDEIRAIHRKINKSSNGFVSFEEWNDTVGKADMFSVLQSSRQPFLLPAHEQSKSPTTKAAEPNVDASKLQAEVERLKNELASMERSSRAKCEAEERKNAELKTTLAAHEEARETIRSELRIALSINETLREDVQEASRAASMPGDLRTKLEAALQEAQSKNAEIEKQCEDLTKKLNKFETLKEDVQKASRAASMPEDLRTKLEAALQEAQSKNAEIGKQCEDLTNKLNESVKRKGTGADKGDADKVRDLEKELSDAKERFFQSEERYRDLSNKWDSSCREVADWKEKMAAAKKEHDDTLLQGSKMAEEAIKLKEDFASMSKQLDESKHAAAEVKKNAEVFEQKLSEMDGKLRNMVAERDQAHQQLEHANKEVQSAKSEADSLRKQLSEFGNGTANPRQNSEVKETEPGSAEIEKLRAELARETKRCEDLDVERANLVSKLELHDKRTEAQVSGLERKHEATMTTLKVCILALFR